MKPTVLVVEPKVHRRLLLLDGLRDDFEVTPQVSLDAALRQIRILRPAVILIGLGRRSGPGLRLVRQVKTDSGNMSLVGLIDWGARLTKPRGYLGDGHADGIFQGTPTAAQAVVFVNALSDKPCMGSNTKRVWSVLGAIGDMFND